jgi:tetratricopeptide (TPR) repeat protein
LAVAALLRARQASPLDAESLLLLAATESNLGAYADAVHDLLPLLAGELPASDTQKAAAASIAGLAYQDQKRSGDAVLWLEQAARVAPTPANCLALAEIYKTSGKPLQAIQVLQRAHTAVLDSAAIAVALGRDLLNAGDAHAALDVLGQVVSQFPGELEAWHWMAEARMSLDEGAAAIAALRELARLAPTTP